GEPTSRPLGAPEGASSGSRDAATTDAANAPGTVAAPSSDRAPFPSNLALGGWTEGQIAHYDSTNLYIKIDGREDYYKSFGFKRLHWVSLGRADGTTTVDIELYDLGSAANALGAYAGERPADVAPTVDAKGMWHHARNASFAT